MQTSKIIKIGQFSLTPEFTWNDPKSDRFYDETFLCV